MNETLRILAEIDEPTFIRHPCGRQCEIGEVCECWKDEHYSSTLQMAEILVGVTKAYPKQDWPFQFARAVQEWRNEFGF